MPRATDLVIALDSSTTACKAIVWDRAGQMVAEGRASIGLLTPRPGWYEQRAKDWWTAAAHALREATSQIDRQRLGALCITPQRETFVPVDAECQPLRDAITWLDERSLAQVEGVKSRFGERYVHEITGKPVAMTPSLYKILWLQEHEPAVLRNAYKIVDVHAFLVRHLTGEWRTCTASADPMGLVDMRSFSWSHELLSALDLDAAQYPDLLPPGAILGEITDEAARATDLPAGLPVVAGAGDGQSAGLGANVTRQGQAYLNLGTAVVSGAHAEEYSFDLAFRTLASPLAGSYTLETLIRSGTFTVSWFVERFAQDLQNVALPLSVEELLEAAARKVPPGAQGLMLVPYWNGAASLYWDGTASGITVGWTGAHRREHLYRAVLEGIAFEQRRATEGVEAALGQRIDEYVVLGGGSKSALWCQIVADITGKRVVRAGTAEATCLGAAILAAVAVGWYDDARSAAAAMTRSGTIFEPDPPTEKFYDQLYREVYQNLYPSLRQSLTRLNELCQQ